MASKPVAWRLTVRSVPSRRTVALPVTPEWFNDPKVLTNSCGAAKSIPGMAVIAAHAPIERQSRESRLLSMAFE